MFTPKTEPNYPPNCITVDDAIAGIRELFADYRVERLKIECVTSKKGKFKLSWDRKNVGRPKSWSGRTGASVDFLVSGVKSMSEAVTRR